MSVSPSLDQWGGLKGPHHKLRFYLIFSTTNTIGSVTIDLLLESDRQVQRMWVRETLDVRVTLLSDWDHAPNLPGLY